jgi:RHS repeat-associated protein
MLVALPAVSSANPLSSLATEVYVAIHSPPEIETLDSTTGAGVGSAASLTSYPVAMAEFTPSGSADPWLLVAESYPGLAAVDPVTQTAEGMIGLGHQPTAIAVGQFNATRTYALVLEASGDEVQVVDAKTLSTTGFVSLGLGTTASAITYNPDGEYAYVTDATTHQVVTLGVLSTSPYYQVLSTYTGSSSFDPSSITISNSGTTAYVSDGSGIDTSAIVSGEFTAPASTVSLSYPAGTSAISADDSTLYVQMSGSDDVAAITLSSSSVSYWTSGVGAGPLALAVDGGTLALGSSSGSTLDLMSTVSASVENTVSLDGTPVAVTPAAPVTLDYEAFVTEEASSAVAMVDLTTGVINQTVTVGSQPVAVAVTPNGQYAYVANYGDNTVSVLQTDLMDTQYPVVAATISLPSGSEPDAVAVSPDGDRVLVVDKATGEISVIDSDPSDSGYLSVLATLYLDGAGTSSTTMLPDAIALSPDGTYGYVTDGGDATVSVLSLSSPDTYGFDANSTSLGFSGEPQDIAISPNDQTAYVTDSPTSGNGYLRNFAIDPANGILQIGSYVTLAHGPSAVALSPNGGVAYVTDSGSNEESVVNTATNSVTTSVSATGTATADAVTPDGSDFLALTHGSKGELSVWDASTDDIVEVLTVGVSHTPTGVAVSPMFNDSSEGPPAGDAGDVNASVAATQSIDVEDGVDTATGGYTFNNDDLSLPDIGLGLDLSQEYDSLDASTNAEGLGYGWSFSYGMNLTQVPWNVDWPTGCEITITQENGTPAIFYPPGREPQDPCPTSGYNAPGWEQASLSYVSSCYSGNPCWDMTRDGSTQYLFSVASGDLMFEKDLNGNTVTLAYSSGMLSTVTGQSGVRQLSVTWSGSKVTEVQDSAGRTATFGYTSGNLTSLTLDATSTGDTLSSHEWAFSYNSSHQLTDWWSPDNEATYSGNSAEATQITYNSAGEVTKVIDPDWLTACGGGSGSCAPTTTFSYPSFDTSSDTGTVMISDANENYDTSAAVNDGNGNTTLDRYVGGVLVSGAKGYGYESDTTSPYDAYPMSSAITTSVPDPFTWLSAESLDADGNLTTTSYDASGNTLQSTDAMGRTTSYVDNHFNEVEQETDPLGHVTSSTYDSNGNLLTTTNGDGDVTSYAYNSNGEKCAMLNANGYAAGDSLSSCPSGSAPYVTAYGYDSEGDQTSVTTYDGPANTVTATYVTSSLYNSAGQVCASLSADGHAVGDSLPGSCPSSGAAYETASTAFDVFGNVLSSIAPTNASGGTTTTAYDPSGNKLTLTDPAGDVTTSAYDPDDQLCWSEPLSVSSPTCASPPTGSATETTSYSYDPDGSQVSSVDPDGNVTTSLACLYETTSAFDNLGNTLSTTTPSGGTTCANETTSTTTSTYDADGNVLTSADGSGITTTSTYDADGELCWSAVAVFTVVPSCGAPPGSGAVTTYTYDAEGNQLTVTDPAGDVTTSTYDGNNQVCWTEPLAVSIPLCASPPTGTGTETTTDYYDADGNVVAVTGPNGNPGACDPLTTSGCADTTYNLYDEQQRQLSTTDPSGNETTYTSDADAATLTETLPSSTTGTYTYNGAGDLIKVVYSDGTPTVSYQYGSNGQRCWMYQGSSTNACSSPPSGATTYSYDTSGRLTSTTNAAGATVTYGYDASSNLACVSYPNTANNTCTSPGSGNGVVTYTYNQTDQLTSLTDWAGDTLTFTYNANGQQCWVSTYAPSTPSCASPPHQSGAVTTSDSFDTLGTVSEVKTTTGTGSTNLLDLAVSRNADEDITAETPTVGATAENTDNYGYNDTNQVDSGPITGSSGSTTYSYTPTGSITADTTSFRSAGYSAAGALCWTYTGTSSNACSSAPSGATVYSTDSDGQRTAMSPSTGNPASYGWETESGRLTCANTNGTSCSTSSPTATTTLYTYDGNGLRTSATIGSTTTPFTWGTVNGNPNLLSDGTWDYVYANGGATPIEQLATTGSSPTTDLLLSDESGNVRGLVQLSSGGTTQDKLVDYTDYDAYGNPITESGGTAEAGGITTAQTGISSNYVGSTPWGFGEGYTDSTGLVYLIHRYYDPATAQFMSVDPAVAATGQPYIYTDGNPVNRTDPTGEKQVPPPVSCTTAWASKVLKWFVPRTAVWTNPCLTSIIFWTLELGGQAGGIVGGFDKWWKFLISVTGSYALARAIDIWTEAQLGLIGDVTFVITFYNPKNPFIAINQADGEGGYRPVHANQSGEGWYEGVTPLPA